MSDAAAQSRRGRKKRDFEIPVVLSASEKVAVSDLKGLAKAGRITTELFQANIDRIEEAAKDRALKEWGARVDPEETSLKNFIESFKVPTKRLHLLPGQRRKTNIVDFRERDAQRQVRECMERQWAPHDPATCRNQLACTTGHGASIIVLKDRTQGISEMAARLMWDRIIRGGGGRGKMISKEKDATREMFQKISNLRRRTPDWVLKHVLHATIDADSREEFRLIFEPEDGESYTSEVSLLTAGGTSIGRGGDPRWLHISEFPWWKAGQDELGGLLESWLDAPGNFVLMESTGKEMDLFYDMWVNAREGRGIDIPIFFSWLTHPEKVMPFLNEKQRAAFIKSVGRSPRYSSKKEQELRDIHGATLEQLNWRRNKIDSKEIAGNIQVFDREHPTVDADAFLQSSGSIFPKPILMAWNAPPRHLAKRMDAEAKIIEMSRDRGGAYSPKKESIEVLKRPGEGRWHIYHEPEVGVVYGWGADVAEGHETHSDGRREADYSTICVGEVLSKKIVAIFRAHVRTELFAEEILKGSIYYGHAKGYLELNNHGHSVMTSISDLGASYLVLQRERLQPSESGKRQLVYEHGWKASPGAKARAVNRAKTWFFNLGLPPEGDDVEPRVPLLLLSEALRYEKITRGGSGMSKSGKHSSSIRMGASVGHDDVVASFYVMLEALALLRPLVPKLTSVAPQLSKSEKAFLLYLQAGARSGMDQGYDQDLGSMF